MGTTTAFQYIQNGLIADQQFWNQFVDVLTGTTGSIGITVNSLTVNGAINAQANSIPFSALAGSSVIIGASSSFVTGSVDQITLSGGNSGSNTVTIAATQGAGGDTNINIVITPLGTGVVDMHYATTALGGGSTPTFGTIGGSGPATAAQNSWLKVLINGTASFIPIWR